jgi:hypothetical protein
MKLVLLDNLLYSSHINLLENPTNGLVADTTDVVSTYSAPQRDVLKNAS